MKKMIIFLMWHEHYYFICIYMRKRFHPVFYILTTLVCLFVFLFYLFILFLPSWVSRCSCYVRNIYLCLSKLDPQVFSLATLEVKKAIAVTQVESISSQAHVTFWVYSIFPCLVPYLWGFFIELSYPTLGLPTPSAQTPPPPSPPSFGWCICLTPWEKFCQFASTTSLLGNILHV